MKLFFSLLLAIVGLTIKGIAQNVGINNTGAAPHATAMLDVTSTTKGFLPPRMTSAQRNAIVAPAVGLLVYDTDARSLYHYSLSGWISFDNAGGPFTLPFVGSTNQPNPAFKITNTGNGPAILGTTTHEFGIGVQGNNTTSHGYSFYAYSRSPNAVGVKIDADSSTGLDASSTEGIAINAKSINNIAIKGTISNNSGVVAAIYGTNNHPSGGVAIYGVSNGANGAGLKGESNAGIGVYGYGGSKYGVYGTTVGGTALYGYGGSGYALETVGKVKISGGNTNPINGAVLTSDATGNAVWKKNNVGFSVTEPNPSILSIPAGVTTTVHLFKEEFDYGNDYNVNTGTSTSFGNSIFVSPVTGLYHFDAALALDESNSDELKFPALCITVQRGANSFNAAEAEFSPFIRNTSNQSFAQARISKDIRLVAGDIVTLKVYHNSAAPANIWIYGAKPHFGCHLVFED